MLIPVNQLQISYTESIEEMIADVIDFLPVLLAAIVILIVGWIIGRVLAAIVTRVVDGIGIGEYSRGTAVDEVGDGDTLAHALGMIVAYYVYFVAIVAAANVLGITQLTDLLSDLGASLPTVLGALVVLVIGFVVGRIIGDIVADLVGDLGVGRHLRETPLERSGDGIGFGLLVGKLVTYYIYLITLLAVADILSIDALSELLNDFAGYLPALLAGVVVLLVGIWLAERLAEVVAQSGDGRSIHLASLVVKVFVYYVTITIALATMGIDVDILTTLFSAFVVAFFGALALALAIGIGLAVGLGGQDYVAENIDSWVSSAKDSVEESDEHP